MQGRAGRNLEVGACSGQEDIQACLDVAGMHTQFEQLELSHRTLVTEQTSCAGTRKSPSMLVPNISPTLCCVFIPVQQNM